MLFKELFLALIGFGKCKRLQRVQPFIVYIDVYYYSIVISCVGIFVTLPHSTVNVPVRYKLPIPV